MAFPASGHTELSPGQWAWKSRPNDAGKDGPFDAVSAIVIARLSYGGGFPAEFSKGQKLEQSDFPGTRLPEGDFWCDGFRVREENFDHVTADVRWIGVKEGENLDLFAEGLIIETAGDGLFALLDANLSITSEPNEYPQGEGTEQAWLTTDFLAPGGAVTNPATGEKQRGRVFFDKQSQSYSGVAVGTGGRFLPLQFRCMVPRPDLDGALVDLNTVTAGSGEQIIRVSNWWPRVSLDTNGWRRATLTASTFRRLGQVRFVKWDLVFEATPQWSL